jgi:hypothetical protein
MENQPMMENQSMWVIIIFMCTLGDIAKMQPTKGNL